MRPTLPLSALALALSLSPALAQQTPATPSATAPATSPAKEEASKNSKKDEPAADSKAKLDRVEVTGNSDEDAARRASTAAKMVIGREELLRYGDSSVGELMKRLPGVTTGGVAGRGGDIRMRGMAGGYTQILVNGERMPPGFSLDTLPPEQVERIEVMRAPTAEHGARAIAGTINVVLRDAPPKRANELRLGVSTENDSWLPSFNWSRNDKLDAEGKATYNLTVGAQQFERKDASSTLATKQDLRTGAETVTASTNSNENRNRSLNLNARLQWKPANGEMLAIMPFVSAGKARGSSFFEKTVTPTPATGDPDGRFDSGTGSFDNSFSSARLMGQWQTRIGAEGKLDSSAAGGRFRLDSANGREEFKAGAPVRQQLDTSQARNSNWSLRSKFSRPLMEEHSLVAGIEAEGTNLAQTRSCLEDGKSCDYLLDFGDNLAASTRRLAAYAQDDWSVGKQWSFYAGLRWETIRTESSAQNYAVSNTSRVMTPLLHALYKFSDDPKKSRDQIRLSLTRSYRSPELNDMIGRPFVNQYVECKTKASCPENEFIYADYAGNPNLKPELATGIDLAYEHYLSKGGLFSANVFVRRIENLMRRRTEQEMVEWSNEPRWISRPRNIGNAISSGLELEAKFRLDQFIADAPQVNVRSNLSLFRSSVDGLSGPHNRLAQQPRYTANLGGDYKLRGLPLSLGASLNFTPELTLRQSEQTVTRNSKKQVFDAYAAWSIDMNTALRLSATNMAPQDYANDNLTTTAERIFTSRNIGRTYTLWALRLEMKV